MDERHVLMDAGILRGFIELPYDDPRGRALLEILYNEFATHIPTGLPVQGVLFKPAKWKEQVSNYMGLPTPETHKIMNQAIIIEGAKRGAVDLYTNNIFNTKYATGGGTSRSHNIPLGFVSSLKTHCIPLAFRASRPALPTSLAPKTSSSDSYPRP